MRINQEARTMDIESRDINYLLPAYLRLYLFQMKNEDPAKIIFPMFRSVPHPFKKGVEVPIEYVPDTSPVAVEIEKDGSNIPHATQESEAKADGKEKAYDAAVARIKELEAELAKGKTPAEPVVESAISGIDTAHQPSPERIAKAKTADKPAPQGSQSDYGSSRNIKVDTRQVAKDIAPTKETIDESAEREDDTLVERVKKDKK